MRLILSALIAFWTPLARAGEPSFDALSHLLHAYAGPVDDRAAEAPAEDAPPESGARLAKIQADLGLMAEGFETFRNRSHERRALQDLPDHIIPELRPFFKDRDSTLDTIYRTLAVTDYTWALRFPEPACEPSTRRNLLLSSKDGLFTDPRSGDLSPWLSRLLGPAAVGRTAEQALDRASSKQALSSRDYELVRVKIAKITEALSSERAAGKERAKLYCLRAEAYETLASGHQAAQGGPIQASRGIDAAEPLDKAASSVLLIAFADGPGRFRAVGAGVVIETPRGPRVMTDARLMPAEGKDEPSLRGFARTTDWTLDKPRAIVVERIDRATGVMVGRLQEGGGIPALNIAKSPAARQDLVRAIGHMSASGAWTVSQGLVTATGDGTFASDAILGPDMLGSPVLNEAGEVAGLIVLSPGGLPSAVQPEHLSRVAEGDRPADKDLDFAAARQSGSVSVLTAALPIVGELGAPGGGLIEAGLPNSLGGVNWEGGGGVGNWRPSGSNGRPSGGYSPSYTNPSSYGSGSSSYSSSGGAELGQALGQALVPLVEALIYKGIPALFRGVGSLFKPKPVAAPPVAPAKAIKPIVAPEEPPKPDPELTVTLRPTSVIEGKQVHFMVTVKSNREDVKTAGLSVQFTVTYDMETSTGTAVTDGSGTALLEVTPSPAARSFVDLQKESARHPALINTGRETTAERICKIVLPGSLALGMLTVTAVVSATPPGATLVYTSGAGCVAAATGLIAGAGAFCAIEFGKEALAPRAHQEPAPIYSSPAKTPPLVKKVESAKEAAMRRADASMSNLDEEARRHSDDAANAQGQPDAPNEPPEESENTAEDGVKVTRGGKRVLGNLSQLKDKSVADAIRARGGGQAQINELETGMGNRTVGEVANAAAKGERAAIRAIKMIKQAATKGQRNY